MTHTYRNRCIKISAHSYRNCPTSRQSIFATTIESIASGRSQRAAQHPGYLGTNHDGVKTSTDHFQWEGAVDRLRSLDIVINSKYGVPIYV
jgi:hypothetical protein